MTDLDVRTLFSEVLTGEPATPASLDADVLVVRGRRALQQRRHRRAATVAATALAVPAVAVGASTWVSGGTGDRVTGRPAVVTTAEPLTADQYARWLHAALPPGRTVDQTVYAPKHVPGPELRVSLILDGGGWVFLYMGTQNPFGDADYCPPTPDETCTATRLADGTERIDRHWSYQQERVAQAVTIIHPDGRWATASADNAIFADEGFTPGPGNGQPPPLTMDNLAALATRTAGTTFTLPACPNGGCTINGTPG